MKNTKNLLRYFYFILGFVFGYQLGTYAYNVQWINELFVRMLSENFASTALCIVSGLLFGFIFVFFISEIGKVFEQISVNWIKEFKKKPLVESVVRIVVLIVVLILATLLSSPIYKLGFNNTIKTVLVVLLYMSLIYFGMLFCNNIAGDLDNLIKASVNKFRQDKDKTKEEKPAKNIKKKSTVVPKILDTSVIIDGRIFDILATGFIDGPIIIPAFVVEELQFVSDSADSIKRNRGRCGLDLVNKMQKELDIEVNLIDKDYPDITEVDAKLVKLAKDMKAKVITNDYNLNKVAEIHGIKVLNTNDLSNTVKTVVLPGEVISVHVLKEGKESNQGVAYLDDGTMIVVENGKHLIGKNITATVTSVLQTSAGRLIFVRPE